MTLLPVEDLPLTVKALIIIVAADPVPINDVILYRADGTITARNSYRPNILLVVNTLEMQRGMKGILCPQAISFPCAALHALMKSLVGLPKRRQR